MLCSTERAHQARTPRRSWRAFVAPCLLVAVAGGSAATAGSAAAATPTRSTLFVIDTSTSMAGARLAEAKEALVGGSSGIIPGARVGLRSFGGPCENGGVERLPIGPFDRATFASAIDSLAIGERGTPTPAALRAAAAVLPKTGDRTIVLVSDGESACGDPCPEARRLASQFGRSFRIDTVGFRTSGVAEPELACIARATGGTYVAADDAEGLRRSIAQSTAGRVTSLSLSRKSIVAAGTGGSTSRKASKRFGARVRYNVSEVGKVRFGFEKAVAGRRTNGTCRKATRANRKRARCTRYVALPGTFTLQAKRGANTFNLTGRLRGRKLGVGGYRLVATAINAIGTKAQPRRASFKVVKRR